MWKKYGLSELRTGGVEEATQAAAHPVLRCDATKLLEAARRQETEASIHLLAHLELVAWPTSTYENKPGFSCKATSLPSRRLFRYP